MEFIPHLTSAHIRVEFLPRGLLTLIRLPKEESIPRWMMPCHLVTLATVLSLGLFARRLKNELVVLGIPLALDILWSGI